MSCICGLILVSFRIGPESSICHATIKGKEGGKVETTMNVVDSTIPNGGK